MQYNYLRSEVHALFVDNNSYEPTFMVQSVFWFVFGCIFNFSGTMTTTGSISGCQRLFCFTIFSPLY